MEQKPEMIKTTLQDGKRRQITLEPIHTKVLPVEWRHVESNIPCGFRLNWINGEINGEKFNLDYCVGSPWLTFSKGNRDFCMNAKELIEALIAFDDEIEKEQTNS
jgi:hypothetical protein